MLTKAFRAIAIAWATALPLVPLAAAEPSSASLGLGYPVVLLIYGIGSFICHQRPERSFHLLGAPLPVCARCTGIYVGAAVAALVPWRTRRCSNAVTAGRVLLLSALPAAASLIFEWTAGQTPGNWLRAATGIPLGAAVAWIVAVR